VPDSAERTVLIDTGPLVAFLVDREPRHEWTLKQFRVLPAPLLTCEPVLTEAAHFLRHARGGLGRLFDLLETGVLAVALDVTHEAASLRQLINRYANVPMSLADACLVRMSEQSPDSAVLTFDADFNIYRRFGRRLIRTIMPR
jgi:uncharacterized protein